MATQTEQDVKTANKLKLDVCKTCVHSECKSGVLNKCGVDRLVCNSNARQLVSDMVTNGITCPKGYWDFTVSSGGCGCGL